MSTAQMIQMNVRVDADVKQRAEDVLALMGSSLTDVVRMLLDKVARGASDYQEVRAACTKSAADSSDAASLAGPATALSASWEAVDEWYRSLGIDPHAMPEDVRSSEQAYEEAMLAHYAEKGWVS